MQKHRRRVKGLKDVENINVKLDGSVPPAVKAILSMQISAEVNLGRGKSNGIYGVAYIAASPADSVVGTLPTVIVEALLLGAEGGTLELGVNIEDAARLICKGRTLNLVFVPVLSKSFKSLIEQERLSKLQDGLVCLGGISTLDTALFCCTISDLVYNKGNKTISAVPKFLSESHLDFFQYLSSQNDNWRTALRG